jgi:hypothetical protein
MDQDLIKGLADGNEDKHDFLMAKYTELQQQKIKRKEYHQHLTDYAEQFEQK